MSAKATNGRLLKVAEVAHRFGVDPKSVYRMIAARELSWVDISISATSKHPRPRIRVCEETVEAFLERRTHRAA